MLRFEKRDKTCYFQSFDMRSHLEGAMPPVNQDVFLADITMDHTKCVDLTQCLHDYVCCSVTEREQQERCAKHNMWCCAVPKNLLKGNG